MSLSTPNSSFIFDLRLLSIRLWAVFRAILRPAALVELGCFLFPVVEDGVADCLVLLALLLPFSGVESIDM